MSKILMVIFISFSVSSCLNTKKPEIPKVKKAVLTNIEQTCLRAGQSGSVGNSGGPPPEGYQTKCCEGLVDREAIEVCGKGHGGAYIYACLRCGDGKCEESAENNCNCPEDCQ